MITANNHTSGTVIMYKNSQSFEVSVVTFRGHYLPPLSICGNDYKRCNLHITSNNDKSIRVAIFPLSSGIGLVSYNYLDTNDTLVYREQFVLTQAFPNCTYMYFIGQTREMVGYCLDLLREQLYMYSMRISIQHDNLSQSIVRQYNVGESTELHNLVSLSNFIFFDSNQDPNGCFSNEGGHVACLANGEVLVHSFSDDQFIYTNLRISVCSNASELLRVGTTCKLVAHCSGEVFVFQIHQQEPTRLSDGNDEKIFLCPDLQFVKLRNGTLSLHTENGTQTENFVSFPLKTIHQGECIIANQQYVFFATSLDGRTLLANFVSSSYQQLGASEHAIYVPSRIKGQIGLVHNESDTLVYDFSTPCHQDLEPAVIIPENLILANHFSVGTRDQCGLCPDPTEATASNTAPKSAVWDDILLVLKAAFFFIVVGGIAIGFLTMFTVCIFKCVKACIMDCITLWKNR